MPDYKSLYFGLFGAISDALDQMQEENYGLARRRLIEATRQAEEQIISEE